MKRLLAQIGITAFTALAVAFYLPEKVVVAVFCTSFVAFILFLSIHRTRVTVYIPVIALTIAAACAANLVQSYFFVIPIQESCRGKDVHVEATLTDEVYKEYSKYYYRLTTDSVKGNDVSTKLLLKTAKPIDIEPFDKISFNADITATDNSYYLSKGYYITVNTYSGDFTVTESDDEPLYYHIIQLRQKLREAFDEYLPKDVSALCKAVFVGDKHALDADTKEDFRYSGASHFVVVSGMHFSIICLLLYKLLRRCHVHRAVTTVITLCMILLYMAVTGFQPSVIRSGVMMISLLGSRLFRRVGYVYNSIGLAGVMSCIVFTPYGAGDIGLILSFAATFAIVTWSAPIYRKISFGNPDNFFKKGVNAVMAILSVSLAANILIFPISVFVFKEFSVVTLLSSLVLYLPVELILILSLLLCLFYYLGPLKYISLFLSWPLYGLCRFVLWIVDGLSSLPFSYVHIGHEFFYIWMGITIILGIIVIARRNNYRLLPYAVITSAVVLIGGTLAGAFIGMQSVSLEVYDCGDGLSVGFNNRGTLYMLAFDSKSDKAYDLLDDLSRRYGGAELAVCSRRKDFNNYSRLNDKEFAISHYLLYDDSIKQNVDGELIAVDKSAEFDLGGASLTVTVGQGKLMSYLVTDEVSVLILPDKFPYKAIPEEFRTADIIVMNEAGQGYEGLACGRLIVSNNAENSSAVQERMASRYREIYDTVGGNVTVDLR